MIFIIFLSMVSGLFFLPIVKSQTNQYPYCTDLIFNKNMIDLESIFYNCSANIEGIMNVPSLYPNISGGYDAMQINVQLALNNLISVDDITNEVTMDLYYRIKWIDLRWNIPQEMFNYLNPHTATSDGINIIQYIQSQNPLSVWKPDIDFEQCNSMEVVSESFKIFPGYQFYWARHIVLSTTQPTMQYHTYPSDIQNFSIVLQSWASSSYFINLGFISNSPIVLLSNFQSDDIFNIDQNQIWEFDSYSAYIESVPQPNFANPDRAFSTAFFNLIFKRQSSGIIVRFILPLALLLLLSGLTYWLSSENRVDTTITVLVSVSALYIVILQNIPAVGYLTNADKFVFWMFLLLIFVCASHQIYGTLQEKVDRWPLRLIYMRTIEVIGRVFVPVIILLYFEFTINYFQDSRGMAIGLLFSVATILLGREIHGLRSSWYHALRQLFQKINHPDCKANEISNIECIVLNKVLYQKWSQSKEFIIQELTERNKIGFDAKPETKVLLRHMHQVDVILGLQESAKQRKNERWESIIAWFGIDTWFGAKETPYQEDESIHSKKKPTHKDIDIELTNTPNPLNNQGDNFVKYDSTNTQSQAQLQSRISVLDVDSDDEQ